MDITLSLREAVLQRVQGKNEEELKEVIEGSVDGDEKTLPGLGVLFEVLWKNVGRDEQNKLINTLSSHLQ